MGKGIESLYPFPLYLFAFAPSCPCPLCHFFL
jgi:hypothetical protein